MSKARNVSTAGGGINLTIQEAMAEALSDEPKPSVYARAEALVSGDRQDDYGDPRENFARIAALWSAYLGREITEHDVALMMVLFKTSRLAHSVDHVDSWLDLVSYAGIGATFVDQDHS